MGAVGGYRLVGGTAMPPLLLDDEEAVAIAVGLRTLVAHAIEGGEEASVRALAKLQQVLPPRLRARVAAVAAATGAWSGTPTHRSRAPGRALARPSSIGDACVSSTQAADRTSSRRRSNPIRWSPPAGAGILIAWDTDRRDWRTFRVDRTARIWPMPGTSRRANCRRRTGRHGCARPSKAARRWRTRSALVEAPAPTVAAQIPDGAGTVEPVDERHCRVRLHADTCPWHGDASPQARGGLRGRIPARTRGVPASHRETRSRTRSAALDGPGGPPIPSGLHLMTLLHRPSGTACSAGDHRPAHARRRA